MTEESSAGTRNDEEQAALSDPPPDDSGPSRPVDDAPAPPETTATEEAPPASPSAPVESTVVAQPQGQAVNVQVNVAAPAAAPAPVVVNQPRSGQSLVIRAVWFVFIGWWAGWLWAMLAWFFNLTIIGLPLGILMMNRLPAVATLKRTERTLTTTVEGSQITLTETGPEQQPWWIRAIFFVLIGWWFSLVWINLAYVLMLTIIGIPIAFLMFDYVAAITTLRRLS